MAMIVTGRSAQSEQADAQRVSESVRQMATPSYLQRMQQSPLYDLQDALSGQLPKSDYGTRPNIATLVKNTPTTTPDTGGGVYRLDTKTPTEVAYLPSGDACYGCLN